MLVISWLPTCTIQPAAVAATYGYEALALTPVGDPLLSLIKAFELDMYL